MSTTAAGRHARSGLDQLDFAEDLFAVVAAAVAVVVTRSVVHVLDHGRGADRRITVNRVGRRRVVCDHFFKVVREAPDAAARDLQVADHAVGLRPAIAAACQARAGRGAAFIVVLGPAPRGGAIAAVGEEPPRRGRRRRPGQSAPER